jgi:threonyl-tRNA synthetase
MTDPIHPRPVDILRRSVAMLTAHAALEVLGDVRLGGFHLTDDGFAYDLLPAAHAGGDLLDRLGGPIGDAIAADLPFECEAVGRDAAAAELADQPFLLARLDDEPDRSEWRLCRIGRAVDLIDDPVVAAAGEIHAAALRLVDISGAYWRGDESRPQFQRIHATVWESPAALEAHLEAREEARARDHRVIGERLDLFAFDPAVGAGLPLWLPDGQVVRDELERWAVETERAWGYQRIATPHITRSELYELSGHLPYFADDMYPPIETEGGVEYRLRPMNCPHHMAVFAARPHSYRELPLRYAEYGAVYRFERSGELSGLMRVRGMTQNDAHIFCPLDQAREEFIAVMQLHEYCYDLLGIENYHMVLALRDPENRAKYHGDEEMWETAERLTREAMEVSGIEYEEEHGGAAHYGPKVDFVLRSATGRDYGVSTNQLDLYLPMRFGLWFANERNERERPAVIHRAPLGSHERFIGFLIEHYAGAFPPWLAPVQVAVVPVGEDHVPWAREVSDALFNDGRRVGPILEGATVGAAIAHAEKRRIPFVLVVGSREVDSRAVSVRLRGGDQAGAMAFDDFRRKLGANIADRRLDTGLD